MLMFATHPTLPFNAPNTSLRLVAPSLALVASLTLLLDTTVTARPMALILPASLMAATRLHAAQTRLAARGRFTVASPRLQPLRRPPAPRHRLQPRLHSLTDVLQTPAILVPRVLQVQSVEITRAHPALLDSLARLTFSAFRLIHVPRILASHPAIVLAT